ncbi:MAG: septum formation initiator family protein [Clostridia bacterium]|nr:septum formation initiator family protein [Clostridia bacterium]
MKSEKSIIVKVAIAVVSVALLVFAIMRVIQYNSLVTKRDALKAQVEKEKIQLEKLVDEANCDFDEEYIKKIARDELGYRMPDEIIYYNDLIK